MRRSKIGRKSKRAREIRFLIERYTAAHPEGDGEPIEPHVIASWAIKAGLWKRPPLTPEEILRKEISGVLRHEYITDPQEREVRKYHGVPVKLSTPDGLKRRWRYYVIFHTPAKQMAASIQIRRRGMVDDGIQLELDWASWNENNVFGAKLPPLDFDLTPDIEDSKRPTAWPEEPEGDGA